MKIKYLVTISVLLTVIVLIVSIIKHIIHMPIMNNHTLAIGLLQGQTLGHINSNWRHATGLDGYYADYGTSIWYGVGVTALNKGEKRDYLQILKKEDIVESKDMVTHINEMRKIEDYKGMVSSVFIVGKIGNGGNIEDLIFIPEFGAYFHIARGIDGPMGRFLGYSIGDVLSNHLYAKKCMGYEIYNNKNPDAKYHDAVYK